MFTMTSFSLTTSSGRIVVIIWRESYVNSLVFSLARPRWPSVTSLLALARSFCLLCEVRSWWPSLAKSECPLGSILTLCVVIHSDQWRLECRNECPCVRHSVLIPVQWLNVWFNLWSVIKLQSCSQRFPTAIARLVSTSFQVRIALIRY